MSKVINKVTFEEPMNGLDFKNFIEKYYSPTKETMILMLWLDDNTEVQDWYWAHGVFLIHAYRYTNKLVTMYVSLVLEK